MEWTQTAYKKSKPINKIKDLDSVKVEEALAALVVKVKKPKPAIQRNQLKSEIHEW